MRREYNETLSSHSICFFDGLQIYQNIRDGYRMSPISFCSNVSESEVSYMKKLLRSTLLESKNEVEIHRSDPNSPLYSVHTFEELKLREEFLRAIYKMGFQKPSKIQETALPTLIADPPINMIAQSQSGTGKTATFLLASLSRVDENIRHPQVLILSPTFELAKQTATVAQQMLQFCPRIEVKFVVRGQVM